MFGSKRSSFTGAARSHDGVFERASGGTLALDEATQIPNEMQIRLLRSLGTRRFYRVGGSNEIITDARVIAATTLHYCGNKMCAAGALGCSLKTLYNYLTLYHRQRHDVGMEAVG